MISRSTCMSTRVSLQQDLRGFRVVLNGAQRLAELVRQARTKLAEHRDAARVRQLAAQLVGLLLRQVAAASRRARRRARSVGLTVCSSSTRALHCDPAHPPSAGARCGTASHARHRAAAPARAPPTSDASCWDRASAERPARIDVAGREQPEHRVAPAPSPRRARSRHPRPTIPHPRRWQRARGVARSRAGRARGARRAARHGSPRAPWLRKRDEERRDEQDRQLHDAPDHELRQHNRDQRRDAAPGTPISSATRRPPGFADATSVTTTSSNEQRKQHDRDQREPLILAGDRAR